jgi:tetraacyldisaccharide 4'-kinase
VSTRWDTRLARRGGAVELLRVPALAFDWIGRARGALYERGVLPTTRVDAPVVSVGNLTAGGTGKTPIVIWLARWFEQRGLRVGVLSRGYGADKLEQDVEQARREGRAGDEARLLARACPNALREQDPDRVRGARRLVERSADVIVLDDGFQHRRLARELDLVALDATRPWGLPWDEDRGDALCATLPRGLLREAPAALGRASAVILTRCDQCPEERLERLRVRVHELAPGVAQIETRHAPQWLSGAEGERFDLERIRDRDVDLVSAIGNPQAFERSAASVGARVREHRVFPDHHPWCAADLAGLGRDGVPVVTTAKDAVKLESLLPAVWVLEIELEILRGRPVLEAQLESLPRGRAARLRASLHEGLHG